MSFHGGLWIPLAAVPRLGESPLSPQRPRRFHTALERRPQRLYMKQEAMTTREEIVATLRRERGALSARYPIRRLALFGSWARGEAREDSDVDVLVDVDSSIGLRFVDLAADLERAVGRRVDLVSRRAIKPSLWARIEPELIDA